MQQAVRYLQLVHCLRCILCVRGAELRSLDFPLQDSLGVCWTAAAEQCWGSRRAPASSFVLQTGHVSQTISEVDFSMGTSRLAARKKTSALHNLHHPAPMSLEATHAFRSCAFRHQLFGGGWGGASLQGPDNGKAWACKGFQATKPFGGFALRPVIGFVGF